MNYIKKILQNLTLLRLRTQLKHSPYREEFFEDITVLNFSRLRFLSYFLVLFVGTHLNADIFLKDYWQNNEVIGFTILDTILAITTVCLLIITHWKSPKNPSEVKPFHHFVINTWVLFQILWTTGISVFESSTANSLPTLLIGVYAAATIFLVRGFMFLIAIVLCLSALISGLFFLNHVSISEMITKYNAVVFLLVLAWVVSRVLFNTRIRSFIENKELEIAKNNLDQTVKERTRELSNMNITLKEEIKERKRYEKSLEEEKQKAEEADKLKSVFLANMSHEIRTPLNGILGFGDLLQNPGLPEEKKLRYLEIINTNGQRLLKLIDDIMDISMIESNQLKMNNVNFRLSHIFPDTYDFFENYKQLTDKGHLTIINDGFPEGVNDHVNLDPSRVQQVLYNLMSNAIKFTEQGTIKFGGKYDNAYALIYVEDTGVGIEAEKCYAVFQRFRQGEESITRKFGGTGLGLSISKGIVELLGGIIWVDSSYKKGTRICFSLPTEEIIEPDKSITSVENISFLDNRVLIVSEYSKHAEGSLTPIIQCINTNCNYHKVEKYNPGNIKKEPAVVVIDVPDNKQGLFQCLKKTRETFDDCHIIVIANTDLIPAEELSKAGSSLIMGTPVNLQVFLLYMRGLLI
ncbi:MAG: ATP-binding protein [Bacteroidales bacterium]|jgi:signal transduction histidine kinase